MKATKMSAAVLNAAAWLALGCAATVAACVSDARVVLDAQAGRRVAVMGRVVDGDAAEAYGLRDWSIRDETKQPPLYVIAASGARLPHGLGQPRLVVGEVEATSTGRRVVRATAEAPVGALEAWWGHLRQASDRAGCVRALRWLATTAAAASADVYDAGAALREARVSPSIVVSAACVLLLWGLPVLRCAAALVAAAIAAGVVWDLSYLAPIVGGEAPPSRAVSVAVGAAGASFFLLGMRRSVMSSAIVRLCSAAVATAAGGVLSSGPQPSTGVLLAIAAMGLLSPAAALSAAAAALAARGLGFSGPAVAVALAVAAVLTYRRMHGRWSDAWLPRRSSRGVNDL
jgi:hypothetical protein